MLRFITAGESHGPKLTAILDGMPAGIQVSINSINAELNLRQQGYGRSARQKIEADKIIITGGIRNNITTGAPICVEIENKDYANWQHIMQTSITELNQASLSLDEKTIKSFRPGHADLAGTIKYKHQDIRDVVERASARETAARVAIGAICLQFLELLDISVASHVTRIGSISSKTASDLLSMAEIKNALKESQLLCLDKTAEELMINEIQQTFKLGDSLGGIIQIIAEGLPIGLGSYTQWDLRLDGLLAQAITSIQAVKAFEIGSGVENAGNLGSQVHDALYENNNNNDLPFKRTTNYAGGIEGGMTNGERLKLQAYMKPIPTLVKGLPSITFPDLKTTKAHYERSDVCAVSSCAIVCKAMTSFILAKAVLGKFGLDNFSDVQMAVKSDFNYIKNLSSNR